MSIRKHLLTVGCAFALLGGCAKDEPQPEPEPEPTSGTETVALNTAAVEWQAPADVHIEGDHITIDRKIHFESDSDVILADSNDLLDHIADVVNHHPEIVDRFRQVMILGQKRDRGEVSEEWYKERLEILTGSLPDEDVDRGLHLTSDFTLLGPLRFHLFRQIRGRVESHGRWTGLHESRVLQAVAGESVDVERAAEAF